MGQYNRLLLQVASTRCHNHVIVAGGHDPVSDSGAESCGEEVRLRTAEVFMTGIQTAITANLEERGEVSGKPRLR